MFKKILGLLLAVVMLASMGTTVFAESDNGNDLYAQFDSIMTSDFEREIANKVISEYLDYDEFAIQLSEDRENALNMLEVVIKSEVKKSKTRSNWYDGQYYVTVPNVVQRTHTSCGAAASVQAIYSKGWEDNIPGSDMTAKQIQLEKDTGIYNTTNGAMVGNIIKSVNKYINPDGTMMDATYVNREMTNKSKEEFKQYIVESLLSGGAPILHAIPAHLSYYPSSSTTGHYIAVSAIDTDNNTITVSDCNWRSEYNGEFTITIDEAYNSVHSKAGRHLIYIPYI